MNRVLLFFLIFALFQTTSIALAEDNLPMVWSSILPITNDTKPNYDDDRDYNDFSGRLYIDDVEIDVALYNNNEQYIVDRKDSAAYFDLSYARGNMLIADHNTQAFGSLGTVQVGMIARIEKENGTIAYYKCVDIFKGHNTGHGITDWNGNSVVGKADLLMYTCFDSWQNVWVVLWDETKIGNEIDVKHTLDTFIIENQKLVEEMLQQMENPIKDTGEYEDIELIMKLQPFSQSRESYVFKYEKIKKEVITWLF